MKTYIIETKESVYVKKSVYLSRIVVAENEEDAIRKVKQHDDKLIETEIIRIKER